MRHTTRGLGLTGLCAAALLLSRPAAAAEAPDWKTPNKDWAKSAVQWLLTDDEAKEFKKLRTDDERAAFAKTFWEKRDPTPGTPANEFQVIFGLRVEQSDKTFADVTHAGSVSERGRVFILLGPPTSTHKDSRYTYWDYEPSDINGIKEKITCGFASVDTGFLLLAKKTFEEYVSAHPETRGIGWTIPKVASAPAGEVAAAPAHEAVEDTSPESRRQNPILDAILAKGSGPTDVPFQVTNDYYAAVDGSTLVVTTVEMPRDAAHGSGTEALLVYGRYAPAEASAKTVNLTGDLPFTPASLSDSPPSSFLFQARRNLKPGDYTEALVVEDKVVKGQMGTLVVKLAVPDYADKHFDMSSVALLQKFGQMEADPGGEKSAGLFSMGSFRIVPKALPSLQKGDVLAFYYQVYNPANDPSSGKPNLESTYTFSMKKGDGWQPFRKPVNKQVQQVELWALDLKDFLIPNQPLPADFRLEAKVTDKVTGQSVHRDLLFTVR